MSSFILSCSLRLFFVVIGGEERDKFVKTDDGCFGRRKCNCGKLRATAWVLVGIERESGDTCLAPVADHFAETLLAIIKVCMLPGRTIVSECWVYNARLCSEGLTHQAFDRSVSFVVHGWSHIYNQGHVEEYQNSHQALLRK